ncbi:dual oxidase 2-like [Liolophura sinensis]|uniref:dual oxidase 2-like n=1 Tax=Liolophura sinensis TaxID=3198878 RepID=UPI003159615B
MARISVWRRTVACFVMLLRLTQLKAEGGNETDVEYEGYDGWYNNLINPDWGAIDGHLLRRLPVAYEDSVYEPSGHDRPNPIEISDTFMRGRIGLSSYRNRTSLLVFFGQQVVEEILDAQRPGCPPEYFNIKIPKGHQQYDKEARGGYEIPLLRSRYDQNTGYSPNNPRQQLNEITPFIDGGLVYGVAKAWTDTLRAFEDGLLAADQNKHREPTVSNTFPIVNTIRLPMANPPTPYFHELRKVSRHFRLGNPRGNENPFLLTWGIVWFRYHNWWAKKLKSEHKDWGDEKLFNEARKWVIGVYQKLVAYDWLPAWIQRNEEDPDLCEDTTDFVPPSANSSTKNGTRNYGPLGEYPGYDPYIHPGISQEFQSAAMRFGHTLVPPGVLRRDKKCDFRMTGIQSKLGPGNDQPHKGLRTCNTYWLARETYMELNTDIDEMLMGMASQVTEREDNIITPDLRGFVFGGLEFSRRDLMAVNIQRGRDHGLPDYNTAREYYGLKRISKWEDINPYYKDNTTDEAAEFLESLERLKDVYKGDLSKLDIWPGGLAETTPCGPGGLFSSIILDQFRRVRNGDRFWFENYRLNGLFTKEDVDTIWNITLKEILVQVTGIEPEDIQDNPFFTDGAPCLPDFHLNASNLEECKPLKKFDYFEGSEVSYALSFLFLGLVAVGVIVLMLILAKRRQAKLRDKNKLQREKRQQSGSNMENVLQAVEWVGPKDGRRPIKVKLHERRKVIEIVSAGSDEKKLRMIDLNTTKKLYFHLAVKDMRFLVIKVPKEYDLALKFDAPSERNYFIDKLEAFLRTCEVSRERVELPEKTIKNSTVTKRDRQQRLEKFFKVIFAQAFSLEQDVDEVRRLNTEEAKDVVSTELSRVEFAEALSMKPNSLFVNNLFPLLDKDRDGYVSFREFLDLMVVFSKGSPNDKARILFEMYDINQSGRLSQAEFSDMLRSLLELANSDVDPGQLNQLMSSMTAQAGLGAKDKLQFEDFAKILNDEHDLLNYARLGWKVGGQERVPDNIPNRARQTFHKAYSVRGHGNAISRTRPASKLNVRTKERQLPQTKSQKYWYILEHYVANYKRQIFWLSLFTFVTCGIFIERAYYYSFEREHAGLRRIAGYGVTVTRGAASVMMWTYSVMLLTMCRNLITFLRETFFHRFIPFDSAIAFHKYIAFVALLFTVLHCVGHAINFYHISTQTANDLTCLFRDFYHATHELPKFHYWLYGTITGMTGVLLTIQIIVIYTFATQYARRNLFLAFWTTHSTYIVLYIFMVMHGSGRLVQPPLFQNFFLGPIILYTLDKMVSFSRKKVEIQVLKAEHLPSDVTCLVFRRPQNFEYKSGQWVRIASLKLGTHEYHPFTLTSSPHEEHLSLHIRAVGPWTNNLRRVYNPANRTAENPYPKLYLDGPFGEGHQDWYKFPVAVLVGGGIGVTPFASILKDIVFKSKIGFKFPCRKVYFLWVTRTQKQFEWLTDIIREVEETDERKLVDVHIFITQFFQKFDMRTTLLYVCERHFQKISGKSLFTGLTSVTHFGRPNFTSFLDSLQDEHPGVSQIGVFSCGPPPMTNDVEKACSNLNKIEGPTFSHHLRTSKFQVSSCSCKTSKFHVCTWKNCQILCLFHFECHFKTCKCKYCTCISPEVKMPLQRSFKA